VTARRAAVFFAAWAAALAVLALLQWPLGERDKVANVELPLAALGTLGLAALPLVLRDRGTYDLPDASPGTALLGVGLTLAGAGAAVGLWLVFIAAPVLILGVVALVEETRS
jgi:hypothetical protein